MVAFGRLRHPGKLAIVPRKATGVDDHPSHGCAVAADELGGGMQDDIRAPIDWTAAVWACKRVIDHQWNTVLVGNGADGLDVQDVDLRVAERFGKNALGLRRDRASDAFMVADVHEHRIDANLAKGDIELVDSATVQGR